MALSLSQLDSITHEHVRPFVVDNAYSAIPLLHRMLGNSRISLEGGTKIRELINYRTLGKASGFDGTGPLGTSVRDTTTGAEFEWVTYEVPVVFSRREEMKNAGKEGIVKLVKKIRDEATLDINDKLGTDLFDGNASASSTSELDGLQLMVDTDDSPKAYGGVDKDDAPNWVAQKNTTAEVLSQSVLQSSFGSASIGADSPSVCIMTQALFDKYHDILVADKRFVDVQMADGGFQTLEFNGRPVLVDSKCGSGTFYWLNERYINFYVHRDWNFEQRPFQEPKDEWAAISHIIVACQLTTNARRMHAIHTGVTTS